MCTLRLKCGFKYIKFHKVELNIKELNFLYIMVCRCETTSVVLPRYMSFWPRKNAWCTTITRGAVRVSEHVWIETCIKMVRKTRAESETLFTLTFRQNILFIFTLICLTITQRIKMWYSNACYSCFHLSGQNHD